ncbi:hypothetical protein FHU41_000937 [Psychromicrobium silvestre]|uniref:Uncharacterized protein n=1 Tax=Psychromicrobium silvestre TaxID=1645614 RepID=A0A7Y9S6P6_9MICC|nr:LppA family lipoprotein [Psychromicrobium silvestre]NYE94716.1 hypothetical protein [Psychromicrobium silvestre]
MTSLDFTSRPSLQSVVDQYDSMLKELETELSKAFADAQWREFQQGTSIEVEVPHAPGPVVNYSSAAWTTELSLRGADREKALSILSETGEKYGFAAPETLQNSDDHWEVTGTDQWGARYEFSSGKNTVLSYLTGLHLEQELRH